MPFKANPSVLKENVEGVGGTGVKDTGAVKPRWCLVGSLECIIAGIS